MFGLDVARSGENAGYEVFSPYAGRRRVKTLPVTVFSVDGGMR
ncbi:MAG: hypothetical protein OEY16_07260 [Alphaproteobacteria bacterium]|nr:hypothetical protein [Alphaproteobacteria bacterium]